MNMYFIAVVLPEELNEKIIVYKNYMHEKYGCAVGLRSPAHITIVSPFWMEEEKEKQLSTHIHELSHGIKSFDIYTNNFSAFKPKTIFIDLLANAHLNVLKEKADLFFNNNDLYKIKSDSRPFHPHITIATRDLFKKDFHEAWPHFSEKKFIEEWNVRGLSLLKHNKKNWDVIYTSQFKNL
ncbi:MAG: 2'-5' RNA ligase family protein [Flavisolibacter sp.]